MPIISSKSAAKSVVQSVAEPAAATESVQEAQQTTEQPIETAPEATVEATNCETTAHLYKYPIVKTTVDLIEELPGVKNVVASSQPVTEFICSQPLLTPVIKTLDNAGNATLNTVDSVALCLQTTDLETVGKVVQEPCVKANAALRDATNYVNEAVDVNIVSPSVKLAQDSREYFNKKIYNTNGKPLIRGAIDPLVKPYNTAIESFTEKYFPDGESVSSDFNSELDRKFQLELNLVKRVIPATTKAVSDVVWAPYNYGSHVVDVFQQNLAKDEKKSVASSLQAVYQSKNELTSEIWDNTFGAGYNRVFGKNSTPVTGETAAVADPSTDPTVEQTA